MSIQIKKLGVAMVSIMVVLLTLTPSSFAQEWTGDEILKKEDEKSFASEITISAMNIVHKSGAKRGMTIKAWMKGNDYTLVRFLYPADIEGTGFLSVKDDDWLYLPALKKVRRLATKEEKGGSFMGSDFSIEDVGSGSWPEDYNAKLLGTEKYEGHDCFVLELTPKNPEKINYSKLKRWVEKENFYSVKTEYYDKRGDLLKMMLSYEFENKEGFWITKRTEMRNVQKGSKTIIIIKEIQVNPEIPDLIFTTRQLEKW